MRELSRCYPFSAHPALLQKIKRRLADEFFDIFFIMSQRACLELEWSRLRQLQAGIAQALGNEFSTFFAVIEQVTAETVTAACF